jgi:hypothetical protein
MEKRFILKKPRGADFINPERPLLEAPHGALVAVPYKHYRVNGMPFMLCDALCIKVDERPEADSFGAILKGVCMEVSMNHILYGDLNAKVYPGGHSEVRDLYPEMASELHQKDWWITWVSLGVLMALEKGWRHDNQEHMRALDEYCDLYRKRATWLESNWSAVMVANKCVETGDDSVPFNWSKDHVPCPD